MRPSVGLLPSMSWEVDIVKPLDSPRRKIGQYVDLIGFILKAPTKHIRALYILPLYLHSVVEQNP